MARDGSVYTYEHPDDRLAPGAGVELTDHGYDRAAEVAKRIHEGNVARGQRQRTDNAPELRLHLRGQLGELAAAVLTGLPWPGSWEWDPRRPDIGRETEVRTNAHDYGRMGLRAPLVIYPADLKFKAERPFILGYPIDDSLRRWWFRGWLYARDATRDEWKVLRMRKDEAWEVPPPFLNNFPVPESR